MTILKVILYYRVTKKVNTTYNAVYIQMVRKRIKKYILVYTTKDK